MRQTKPLLISMGCPAGIGPEIVMRLFAGTDGWQADPKRPVVVVSDTDILARAAAVTGTSRLSIRAWQPGEAVPVDAVPVLQVAGDLHDLE